DQKVVGQIPPSTPLWPTSGFPTITSFNFIDRNGSPFTPDWISLRDPGTGNVIYYTHYMSQSIPQSSSGTYTISYAYWHGVNVVIVALKREHARRAAMPTTLPYPIGIPAAYCGACGKPLSPTENFCTTCGTPRARSPQPSPPQQVPASSSAPPPPLQ